MDIEILRKYCLEKPWVSESMPFDQRTLVFKVDGKMFALTDIYDFEYINVKCEPETAQELRSNYFAVEPAFHMNKTHWNSLYMGRDLPDQEILNWVDHSYDQVLSSLSVKRRKELGLI